MMKAFSARSACLALLLLLAFLAAPVAQAVEVVLCGGVSLKSWEKLRGPVAHDNWWANFVRASTVHIDQTLKKNPNAKFVWIVYRPAYVSRGREDGKDYIGMIRETAGKRKGVKLVFVDTADAAIKAINRAGGNKGLVTSFYYFGHSNSHAFMLDYSNGIIASSKQFIHEKELAGKLSPKAFSPKAECWSYGCYTGNSMSAVWKKVTGIPLWGNTESTRYQPVGWGAMPSGNGQWKQ